MNVPSRQLGLFDTDQGHDHAEADAARARMREVIDQLRAATVAPWVRQIDVILRDGVFRRAMRLVPTDEADVLWAEYDVQMERLYATWVQTEPMPES